MSWSLLVTIHSCIWKIGFNVYNQSGVLGAAFLPHWRWAKWCLGSRVLTSLALGEVVWDGLGFFFFFFLNCRYTRLMNPSCF
jgi:hypothetical protein